MNLVTGDIMQEHHVVSGNVEGLNTVNLLGHLTSVSVAMGLLLSMVSVSVYAADAPEHQHVMDHSMHEHQMSAKGVYTTATANYTVPDIKLVGMKGDEIAIRDLLSGKSPIILNFIFTSCTTICPVMSATFQQVQKQLGPKRSGALMVSISIDPENDTPAKLTEYAGKYGVGPQWKMLTGSLENSLAVQHAFGVFAGDKMNHKPLTFLKAKGSDSLWTRLDGLVEAGEIIKEFDKLNTSSKHVHKE
jgi:protein SCO1/2